MPGKGVRKGAGDGGRKMIYGEAKRVNPGRSVKRG